MSSHSDLQHEKIGSEHHDGNALGRQMTLQLSPDQYEKLFFQPTPARGDLAKRFGNPTFLGVMGFLIPFTTTVLCLLDFRGASSNSLTGISGTYYFLGGIAMNLAGIGEFILGNSKLFLNTRFWTETYQQ